MTLQKAQLQQISGQVERVTFHSSETGFAVLKVKVRGQRELVTVVGSSPKVSPGEWLEAQGVWVIDSEHGQQFKAEILRTSHPSTAEGIERYLGSGSIKGIGPHFASRLVKKFGKDIFNIIETFPRRLLEIKGIGQVRLDRISSAWQEQKVVSEIMVFLHSHGVGTSRAFRIYKTYSEDSIDKIIADPYCLARDIWGIGFKTADQIAGSIGIEKQSDIRARAGVEYTLQELTDSGHCAFPRISLAEKAAKMLEIPSVIIESAIDYGIESERLVQHEFNNTDLIYLRSLDISELILADNLIRLSRERHPCPAMDIVKAIEWVESKIGITLAQAQCTALELAIVNKVLVITGGPGVGKTTLVNAIVKVFQAKKLKVVLSAPTGRAAKRMSEATGMEAKTIHRMLEFDPATMGFKHHYDNPLKGDVFIIDETSMVDLVLAHQVVRAIPKHAVLILVGDIDQLPSIGSGRVLRDIIESEVLPVCRLTEVFRQAAKSSIITNAHLVNQGRFPQWPKSKVASPDENDFYFVEIDDPERGAQLILQLVKTKIPQKFGFDSKNDIQVLTPMQRGILGARNLNIVLQQALTPEGESVQRFGWTFRAGDKVMQIRNNYTKDVFNGDIGRLMSIDNIEKEVTVSFDGRSVIYDFGELDELILSFAISIHKSQGSEYPCVVIPIHIQHYLLLQRNLLYTAITRGKKLVIIVGSKKALAIAVKKIESSHRVTTLKERLLLKIMK